MNDFVKKYLKWKSWEKFFLSLEFFLIIILSLLLYFDFQERLEAGVREEIGTISFKQKTVQRKYSDRSVWETVENNFPVYNRDTIRTASMSDAVITLKDGTTIELDENTLIVLNIREDKQEIDFSFGNIRANTMVGSSGLTIRSGENVVNLKESKASINKEDKTSLVLQVQEGIANLFQGNKKIDLTSGETLALKNNESEKSQIPFRVVNPPSFLRVYSKNSKIPIIIELEGNFSGIYWEVSSGPSFSRILSKKLISQAKFQESLSPGVYYWRFQKDGKVLEQGKLNLVQVQSPKLISPLPGQSFFMSSNASSVVFQWSLEPNISQYEIEVTKNQDWENPILRQKVMGNSFSFTFQEEGKYEWRVRSILPNFNEDLTSAASSFILSSIPKRTPPIPFQPPKDISIPSNVVEDVGVYFTWSNLEYYESYELEVSESPSFKNANSFVINGNSFSWKPESLVSLLDKNIFWRVRGLTSSGTKGTYSPEMSFRIKKLESTPLKIQPKLETSEAHSFQEGIVLKWLKLPIKATYEVVVSKSNNFQNLTHTYTTSMNQVKIQNLEKGEYFWKVKVIDEKGIIKMESEVGTIQVRDEYRPLAPKLGEVINMTNRNSIVFEWESVPNIQDYVIVVYQDLTNGWKPVLRKSCVGNRFVLDELDILEEGLWEWEIYYMKQGERLKLFRSSFRITLDPLPESIEILSPRIQYAE